MRQRNSGKTLLLVLTLAGLLATSILFFCEKKQVETRFYKDRNEFYSQISALEDSLRSTKKDIITLGNLVAEYKNLNGIQINYAYKLGGYNERPSLFKTSEMEDDERNYQQWSDETKYSLMECYSNMTTIINKYQK